MRKRHGYTLIEMLIVIMLVTLALGIGSSILIAALKLNKTLSDDEQRLRTRADLADQFRADVGLAVATPDELNDLKANPSCLILRLSDGRNIAYRWQDGRLEKLEPATSKQNVLPVEPGWEPAFGRSDDKKLVTLTLAKAEGNRTWVVAAALGGDQR